MVGGEVLADAGVPGERDRGELLEERRRNSPEEVDDETERTFCCLDMRRGGSEVRSKLKKRGVQGRGEKEST